MKIIPLSVELIPAVKDVLALGEPYVGLRGDSDYWLYATLFAGTCPVMINDGAVVGAVIAFRSQDHPDDVYVQDVAVHPRFRGQGVAAALLGHIIDRATAWGCRRLYLTSAPGNIAAGRAWAKLGFTNMPGDLVQQGVQVTRDYKGPGRHRAVYELITTSES